MSYDLKDKHMVLGVSGGIAAYKSVELLRLLTKQGASVRVIMTANAQHFVGWMTFEALTGIPVMTDLFDQGTDASIKHIDYAQAADAAVIAPATANIIGKLANGIADDALTTFMLAVTAPKIICPSMNTHMFESPAVQRNLELLRKDGCLIIEPGAGELACGTVGPGRLPEPEEIVAGITRHLAPKDLSGKRVLVSAGPTRETIDPVRFISNPSSGKMGFAVARAASLRGAEVTLVTGPTDLQPLFGVHIVHVTTAAEMARAIFEQADSCDIIVKTAAVADYRPDRQESHKIKKDSAALTLKLEKTTDILKELGRRKKNQVLVGFAAETRDLEQNATQKLRHKNLDIIVGNLIGPPSSGFGADTNIVTFFYRDGTSEQVPMMEKEALAHLLLDRICSHVTAGAEPN